MRSAFRVWKKVLCKVTTIGKICPTANKSQRGLLGVVGGSSIILRSMCRLDVLCRRRLLPDQSSDVSVGFAVSPAAPSGSFVRNVVGICCVAGGSFRILRPMCRWDLLCRRELLPGPLSDVSVGFAVSPAAPFGSFVRCVGGLCCVAGGSFRILRPMCRWVLLCRMRLLPDPSSDVSVGVVVSPAAPSGSFVRCVGWTCCVAGGSFRILRPMCRWDLLCRRRLLQDPSSDVSAGLAVSNADPSGSFVTCVARICSATGVSFRIRRRRRTLRPMHCLKLLSPAAPSGAFVRCVGWMCCVAGGSVWSVRPMCRWDFGSSPADRSGSFVRCVGGLCCAAGGSFRFLRQMCWWDLLCCRRLLPDHSLDGPAGMVVFPAAVGHELHWQT